jgi:hypothetical protein
MPSGVVHF